MTKDIRTKTCATTDHLIELNLRAHLFEEDEVKTIRHVNTGIHHIHRHDNLYMPLRFVTRRREDVDEVLPIVDLVVDENAVVIS